MQYFGGKSKIATQIASLIADLRSPEQLYVEPFIGGGSVFHLIPGPKIGNDARNSLIDMYLALLDGWEPPLEVSEELYKLAREGQLPPHLTAFIGFGCSFSGKWFGGYARNRRGDNYAAQSANSLKKKIRGFREAELLSVDYRNLQIPDGSIVYCDPPYSGTTGYSGLGTWNSDDFWESARKWSASNIVLISEYSAPGDFLELWSFKTHTEIRGGKEKSRIPMEERVFVYQESCW